MRIPYLSCWLRLKRHSWVITHHEYWTRHLCSGCGCYRLVAHSAEYWGERDREMAELED